MYKIAASAAQLTNRFFFILCCSSQLWEQKQKLDLAYLMNWHNSILVYKLKTIKNMQGWKSLKS